ncbi:MAG: iron ABC transporter permease [Candidatus Aminicenantes bacterium]|nr:iron ABC transporter permease [Candidatus Aminicenantes bacterium]
MSRKLLILCLVAAFLLVLVPFLGIIPVGWADVLRESPGHFIFWSLRVPRTLVGFIAGASLALAGLVCQNVFKNDLATPDLLGISSGAAAGTVIALKFKLRLAVLGMSGLHVFSFAGALSAVLLIFFIVRVVKNVSLYTFLMCGIAINFFFSSVIVFFQYVFDYADTFSLLRWMMGGIANAGYREAALLLVLLLLFLLFILFFAREFQMLSAGDEFAAGRGLNVGRFRAFSFLVLAFFIGAVVSVCGPIGFIALVVPHVSRLWGGNRFQATVAITFLLGGCLLVSADLLARSLVPPLDIPVGIVTSMFGAPFFLLLLLAQLRKAG